MGAVLASLNAADRVVIIPLLSDVRYVFSSLWLYYRLTHLCSGLVGQLLEVVLKLVGELLVEIVPLLRGILKFVIDLNVRYILGLLL